MKRWQVIILILLVILTGFIIAGSQLIKKMNADLERLNTVELEDIDLSTLEDGTYTGTYQAFPIDVEVIVTIDDHRITEIEITKHINGQGSEGEMVILDVIDTQSLDVDLITGATYSSKVILLAIEDALT
ncbi:MAG: FMN-binding protein [Acholeplasma sp.]|jgi:uncharacterized protein with FMN-binding domain|nr:MAG: FMN-binding protein [Acholeplasma sp.]